MRGLWFVAALLLVGMTTPAVAEGDVDVDIDIPGLDATDLRGHALVWEDTAFHLEPWEGGLAVRFAVFNRRRRDEVGRAIPVRIVDASMREFVEIEFPDRPACTWRLVSTDSRIEALRVFVKRVDLAPVLVKPFTASYRDGTSVRLAAGVPVMPTASGLYMVSVRGDKLRLPIPHASVGYLYTPGRVADPELPAGDLYRFDRSGGARIDDEPFEVRAQWVSTKPAKHGETVKVGWSTRCIDLVAEVPAASLRKTTRPPSSASIHTLGRGAGVTSDLLPRGAPLSTPGGRQVAVAAEEIRVGSETDDMACFAASLTMSRLEDSPPGHLARSMSLCAPANLVERSPEGMLMQPTATSLPTDAPPDVTEPPAGAKRTAKGVWYKVLLAGPGGRKPTPTSTVKVHYAGWTTDGTLFDSSITRGRPAEFPLTGVIAGWTDGLQVMSIGDKARFWIPEELAYKGSSHAPQGMLVFDVYLLDIK